MSRISIVGGPRFSACFRLRFPDPNWPAVGSEGHLSVGTGGIFRCFANTCGDSLSNSKFFIESNGVNGCLSGDDFFDFFFVGFFF